MFFVRDTESVLISIAVRTCDAKTKKLSLELAHFYRGACVRMDYVCVCIYVSMCMCTLCVCMYMCLSQNLAVPHTAVYSQFERVS